MMRLKNPSDPRRVPLDVDRVSPSWSLGLGSLQYVLGEGQQNDWFSDTAIVNFAIASATGLLAFIAWELFGTKNPVVDLRVLRYKQVAAGSVLAFSVGVRLVRRHRHLSAVRARYSRLHRHAERRGDLRAGRVHRARRAARRATRDQRKSRHALSCSSSASLWSASRSSGSRRSRRRPATSTSLVIPNIINGFGLSMLFIPISIAMLERTRPAD